MGLGNLLGSLLGVAGLLWAWNIALGTEDTFAVLVAVLDTNFWLSTHVICVSLGYSATLVAGALGATYILGGLFTPLLSAALRQELARLIYGTVCFGLLFSFVGTVLGGLWADDSWGRFWGWDPKENGALMIVLWNAVVLHARWGGLVRQRGMAALAVLGNAVTAWSWEGVNQLGVGLHAYALSDANKFRMLVLFWLAQMLIAGLALIPLRFWWSKFDAPTKLDPRVG
jgi:ABC-type transport system involved in cytochrome c biogenesis permease subunit